MLWVMTLGISLGVVLATTSLSVAAVSGPCSNCHTMHNSQNASTMAVDEEGGETATAYPLLTKSNCLGCHNGSLVIPDNVAPNVMMSYTTATDPVSAGGSFAVWTASNEADDAKVHNVQGIVGLDIGTDVWNTEANGVPGLGGDFTAMNELSGVESDNPEVLTCAGAYGCHGNIYDSSVTDSDEGISGFHHGSDAYRFLMVSGGTETTVEGIGSDDYESTGASESKHNVYSASTTQGINRFCANCHPDFHDASDTQDGAGSWIRHPTDNLLSAAATDSGWDLSRVTTDYQRHPFAWQTISDMQTNVAYSATDPGASVACVSCHRAHGSPYADLLRFPYDEQDAGSTTVDYGCLGCHEKQRGA